MNSNPSMARTRVGGAFYAWLRDRWAAGLALRSDIALILVASVAWTVLYNLQFWHQAIAAMWHPTPGAVLFLVSLCVVVVCLQALLLALVPTRLGLRIAASALFLIAATQLLLRQRLRRGHESGHDAQRDRDRSCRSRRPDEFRSASPTSSLLGVASRRAGLARVAPLLDLARAVAAAAGLQSVPRSRCARSRCSPARRTTQCSSASTSRSATR